ncbi:HD domain-containing protein [Bacillus amyloliquefaciens]|uniref:HD domain-containing protein n=1 Tax=Bacillus amyloliquefaciens TaxID=1390 RepID=UPI001ABD0504|nr:HD domain-containing protein [Bacillus amyloliquefaciens]MBO3652553.1 HD domain-containing protein [Bacillus amyloliquefaciens]MCJ2176407.1 HD domain-containing protein [Bacillus amyloliquefaciens]MCR4351067.1 HD domain-containing protein [Bacillus amyloliquefaciens]MCR4358918.1 HD domain-containing protein [Bacillus amyloliquefaciens]
MKIHDFIYGSFRLEPVLAELIHTQPLQRLKNIHQGGASYLVNPKWNVTRFEHSVGVMLLIKRLGGSLEEQIAGLLHDISHTAFSHVIDFVLDNPEQDFHDQIFEKTIQSSEIPSVLQKHGFNLLSILPIEKWSLLEQPLPLLCADRIDYTLRDLSNYNMISLADACKFANELKVVNGKICLKTVGTAEWFVKAYYTEVIDFFLHPLNVYGYAILTDILKIGMAKQIIYFDDLLLDDKTVWTKLINSKDHEVLKKIKDISKNVINDEENYDIHQKKKVRIIDPLVLVGNVRMKKATELSAKVIELNQYALEKSLKGTFVRVLNN